MAEWEVVIRRGAITDEAGQLRLTGAVFFKRGSTEIEVKLHTPYDHAEPVSATRQHLAEQAVEALRSAVAELADVSPTELERRDQPPNPYWTTTSASDRQ